MKQTRDSIADVWGPRTPYRGSWPVRVDEHLVEAPERWVQSACVLCSNGCALDIGVKGGKIVGVRGRGADRVNHGRLGPKGLHGWVANSSADRLTRPLIRKEGHLQEASWEEAMALIVRRSKEIRDQHTSGAIGFYTSGQLFLEEYYTLGVIGKAGLGTPHMDGNTRLCTATAAAALKESFGSDGQPGSYTDLDTTDAIFDVGHNMAEQQTVLYMRLLDRRRGPNPPKFVIIDPRAIPAAKEADVHLQLKVGSNVAVMNGLLHLIIKNKWIDSGYIGAHTIGFDDLEKTVQAWTPARVEQISTVPAKKLQEAAEILGTAPTLVSAVLQGFYQSMQATAASCQVNNLHLIRGLIGRPGCGIYQMNGQPTAQNTRECGADGDLPAFRNWDNPKHIDELARLWNVDRGIIPHWTPPTHAMQIFRYAEQGSIKMLWISATNPAVSLPDLSRVRPILKKEGLFVVVQDAFMTETAALADVVLPAAIWGEKTGCFTNVDRTVHLSQRAIKPPGEARADLDIFLDYARRMDFRDKDGAPLIKWKTPEEAFNAWRECTRGRPCDYTGISYAKLTGGSGIQWPCNEEHPDGATHLYAGGVFATDPEQCETYGHDLLTGGAVTPEKYRAKEPNGRAFIKPAEYLPPHEAPDEAYPFWLTTGRIIYHFHTRTKTGRSKALNDAAPDGFVEIAPTDAERLGIQEGDWLEVTSRRGRVQERARITGIHPGHLFIPFHYGYWDEPGRPRAANELTLTEWDPVSKQPQFKYAAVQIRKIEPPGEGKPEGIIGKAASAIKESAKEIKETLTPDLSKRDEQGLHVGNYLGLLHGSEGQLAQALLTVAEHHRDEPDVHSECKLLAAWSHQHTAALRPLVQRYGEEKSSAPENLQKALFHGPRTGGIGLLRDLHDLWLLANEVHLCWTVLLQAARALHDEELKSVCKKLDGETERQIAWLLTRIKQAAAQALAVK
ncbi:MAG: nitrate reductase [Nitrospirae bacterium]|nr:nitrate reductase [Candidatus Manganitrophaceae bacterium]